MTDIPDKRYFRPDELAEIIEKPVRSIRRWIDQGKIKHIHFGSRIAIPCEEVERILREGVVMEVTTGQ